MAKIGPRQAGAAASRVFGEILEAISGPTTATIYKLDPTGLLPVEPLIDLVPAVSPNRQSIDIVASSTYIEAFRVTRNPIQSGFDVTSHVKKELATLKIQGVISGAPILAIAGAIGAILGAANAASDGAIVESGAQALGAVIPGFPAPRRDIMQLQMLRLLAGNRKPVMVVTPDLTLPRALITRIQRVNGPSVGVGTEVSIDFVEARIIAPQFVDAVLDLDEVLGGKTSTTNAGGQATSGAPPVSGLG